MGTNYYLGRKHIGKSYAAGLRCLRCGRLAFMENYERDGSPFIDEWGNRLTLIFCVHCRKSVFVNSDSLPDKAPPSFGYRRGFIWYVGKGGLGRDKQEIKRKLKLFYFIPVIRDEYGKRYTGRKLLRYISRWVIEEGKEEREFS